jgi:hypothetical protein
MTEDVLIVKLYLNITKELCDMGMTLKVYENYFSIIDSFEEEIFTTLSLEEVRLFVLGMNTGIKHNNDLDTKERQILNG